VKLLGGLSAEARDAVAVVATLLIPAAMIALLVLLRSATQ